jgi:hypothetical protein
VTSGLRFPAPLIVVCGLHEAHIDIESKKIAKKERLILILIFFPFDSFRFLSIPFDSVSSVSSINFYKPFQARAVTDLHVAARNDYLGAGIPGGQLRPPDGAQDERRGRKIVGQRRVAAYDRRADG